MSREAWGDEGLVMKNDDEMIEAGAQVLFTLPGFRDPPSVARKIVKDILAAIDAFTARTPRVATWYDTNDPESLDERGPHD